MGRMLDALKQIESQADANGSRDESIRTAHPEAERPEAELSFPDNLLAETAALLDRYEKGELPTVSSVPAAEEQELPQQAVPPVHASLAATPGSQLSEPQIARDFRHVDLAVNILSQIPARGTVNLLFAAPAASGVFAPSLVPLFATLAEQAGGRTLVVECDFCRPVLASRFSLEPRIGLDGVLAARAAWTAAVCRTDQNCLDVICAKAFNFSSDIEPAGKNAAATPWQSQADQSWTAMKSILAAARDKYRLVLLENVSAAGEELPQLASLCHGTYLLLRAAQTPRRTARAAVAEIKQSGGQLLGCILLDE